MGGGVLVVRVWILRRVKDGGSGCCGTEGFEEDKDGQCFYDGVMAAATVVERRVLRRTKAVDNFTTVLERISRCLWMGPYTAELYDIVSIAVVVAVVVVV